MPVAPETIHHHLSDLPRLRSLDAAFELFDALGYQYAGELPLPIRNWPAGVRRLVNRNAELPIYLAQHRDFRVVYTHLTTDHLSRTVERPIVEHTLHRLHPYALFVFANRDLTLWDFVNVKYSAEDGARRARLRRIHVGPAERLHTAAQRMALLAIPAPDTSALELQSLHDRAFDVEEVTKQFYRDYVQVFSQLCDDIARRNPRRKAETEAQVLLDRLLFLYFIQKKGWLDDQRDYLHRYFQAHYRVDPDGTDFYSDFLFPLFVALSNEGVAFPSLGDVPFLNGGLFEVDASAPLADQLIVGNRVFCQVFDGLLERYNFTVREDTPLDVEVAIDPEMLGQIFENLVLGLERGQKTAEDRRKATGSYYTPRVIVHFMCRQALKEYLAAESSLDPARIEALMGVGPAEQLTPEEVAELRDTIAEPEARLLRALVAGARVLDPAVGSGAFLVGMLYQMVALTKLLDVRLRGQKRVQRRNYDYDLKRGFIERNLYGVDVQPEAVRICELRLWLSLMVDYERRAGEPVPTLPNLSYRIRVGDSLIERFFGEPVQLDQLADEAMARQLIDRIQTEKRGYFKEPDLWEKQRRELRILGLLCQLAAKLVGAKRGAVLTRMSAEVPGLFDVFGEGLLTKRQLKAKQEAEAELARYDEMMEQVKAVYERVQAMQAGELPAGTRDVDALRTQLGLSFLWRLDFAEVFADKGGFDVVIANPPYIRQERFSEQKPLLRAAFPDVYHGVADLYVYFYRQGLALARPRGVLTFISSNKFFRAGYGKPLRTYLRDKTWLKTVIDFGDLPIFEATTYPCVLVASNRRPGDGEATAQALNVRSMATLERLAGAVQREGWPQPQRSLRRDGWALERPEVLALLEKLRLSGTPLGECVGGKFYRGIVTGLNKAFVIDQATRDQLIAEDPRSAEIIKPWLQGRDIKRWQVNWPKLYLLYVGWDCKIRRYPTVLAHLKQSKKALAKRPEVRDRRFPWYALSRYASQYYLEFDRPKIVWPNLCIEPRFALDLDRRYVSAPANILPIALDNLFLVGILNSSVTSWFMKRIAAERAGGFLEYKPIYVTQIPIPDTIPPQRAAIEALVRELLDAEGQGPQVAEWERELNALVYGLYGLTEEEISVVEGQR